MLALACGFAAGPAGAQNLLQINEVHFEDQWIEVANFDVRPFDLSEWSLYQATQTQGMAQGYWWPFPGGTVVPPGAFLRVRWLRPVESGNTNPLLLDTGDTSYHFLFFLRGERLGRAGGALGLVATKDAGLVNTASYYRDFIAWGSATAPFPREDLAAQNGRWLAGARLPTAEVGQSLAFDSQSLAEPTSASAFFRDSSPTPGAANRANESATTFGSACVVGLGEPAQLSFVSIPVHGNTDFRVRVDALVGAATTLSILWGMPDLAGQPWGPCRTYLDLALPWAWQPITVQGPTVLFRPDLEDFTIPQVAIQGIALRPNGSVALTNGGRMRN